MNLSTILFLDPLLCDSAKAGSTPLVKESVFDGAFGSTNLVESAIPSTLGRCFVVYAHYIV